MKKILAVMIALVIVLGLAACTKKEDPAPVVEPKTYKLGLGFSIPAGTIKAATADADASVQVNPTVAVVLVDADGRLESCLFDVAQTKVSVNDKGEVLNADAAYKTKLEKGSEYGMQKASQLKEGEWYQQAAFLQEALKGKTLAEINGIAIKDGYADDADILAGCTMHITDFVAAINDAYSRLIDAGSATKLTLGIDTSTASSKNLSADADGVVSFESYYGASALDESGKITAAVLDATQLKFPVTEGGVIGESSNYLSKIQLKENYGMHKVSPLKEGEWYQQSAYFAGKLVGLDKAGVKAIVLDDKGRPTDADLLAGCTVHVNEMIECLLKGM